MAQLLGTDTFSVWRTKLNETSNSLGDLSLVNLASGDRSSFVVALNKLISLLGNLSQLNTSNKNSIVSAINDLVTDDDTVRTKLSEIGILSALSTAAKNTLVAAINELVVFREATISKLTDIGVLASLNTTVKNNLVVALNEVNAKFLTSTITVGSKTTNKIPVTIQLKDIAGNTINEKRKVSLYLADDSLGDTISTVYPDGNFATTAGVVLSGTNKIIEVVSSSAGQIIIEFTHSATKNYYLVVIFPSGNTAISPIITF